MNFHTKGTVIEMGISIWAHRGASAYAPENTLEAFELAIKQGADGIELDTHTTADGILVVCHDGSIARTSDGRGLISEMTLEQLRHYDYSQPHPDYSPCRIPTLREVYDLFSSNSMVINVEIKADNIEKQCLDTALDAGISDRIIYSSFSHKAMLNIKELSPSARVGLLYGDTPNGLAEYCKKFRADAVHPHFAQLYSTATVEICHKNGIAVHPWTVDGEDDIIKMQKLGADAVITNVPDRAVKLLKK